MGRIQRDDNKFTWVIKDFSRWKEIICSDTFTFGNCKWRLKAYPMGDKLIEKHMSLYLDVADSEHLPSRWSRDIKLEANVVNQCSEKSSNRKTTYRWVCKNSPACGFVDMIPHSRLFDEEGFVVNGQVVIVVTIYVITAIGKVDDVVEVSEEKSEEESEEESEEGAEKESEEESEEGAEKESEERSEEGAEKETHEESEEGSRPLKKIKLSDDGVKSNDLLNKTQQVKEVMDVNGFQVLPSQVGFVRRIFEKHPDMAQEFRAKSQHLRTASMTAVLSLIETLCQSPQELSNDDLVEGGNALAYVKYAGFKVDWLEKKLKEVNAKKEEEQTGETRIQELEEEIKNTEQKLSDMKALLEKEKAKVLAARVSLTLDDFV